MTARSAFSRNPYGRGIGILNVPTNLEAHTPRPQIPTRHRVRHDKVGTNGVITYRWAGQLKHLGIGREHKGKEIIILAQANQTITIDRATGEIIAEHAIDPNKSYQPKTHHTGERCPAT